MKRFRFVLVAAFAAMLPLAPLATLRAADLSQTATSVSMSSKGKSITRLAGTAMTIAAGNTVYLNASDNKFYLCDNNASLAASKVFGIALNAATAGQPVKVCSSDPAFNPGATLVIGDTLWTSGAAGAMTKTAADNVTGMYVSSLGVANSTTTFNLNITRADAVKP